MVSQFKGVYNSSSDKSYLRQSISKIVTKLGFDTKDIDDINLTLTEILTNVDKYGGRRADLVATPIMRVNSIVGIHISISDYGPGIENIDLAKRDGYTSSKSGSLGLGLGAIERLMDHVQILSKPFKTYGVESGTTIIVVKYLTSKRRKPNSDLSSFKKSNSISTSYETRYRQNRLNFSTPMFRWDIDGNSIMKPGQKVNGDAQIWIDRKDFLIVALIDGLGHGVAAHKASSMITQLIKSSEDLPLVQLVKKLHTKLIQTIGAQIMLLKIDKRKNQIDYIGIGNIRAFMIDQNSAKSFLSLSGTLGKHIPMISKSTINVDKKITIILHSDGISRSWLPTVRRINFNTFSIDEIIDWIMTKYKKKDDDSSIIVIKNT